MQKFIIIILTFISFSVFAAAEKPDQIDFEPFKYVPILHDGRIKSMDSFARLNLYKLTGKYNTDKPAIEWLADSIFMPDKAYEQKIIKIDNQQIRSFFKLPLHGENLYSLRDVMQSIANNLDKLQEIFKKEGNNLTSLEKKIIDLYVKCDDFLQIIRSFKIIFDENNLELFFQKKDILNDAKEIFAKKGEDITKYSEEEQHIVSKAYTISNLENIGKKNILFRVIPTAKEFISPWQAIIAEKNMSILYLWQDLYKAYLEKNSENWVLKCNELKEQSLPERTFSDRQLELEVLYNKIGLVELTIIFYIFSLIALYLKMPIASNILYHIGALMHFGLVVIRMIILERPPVSNLYESILFVSFIIVVCASLLDYRLKSDISKIMGAILSFSLLGISYIYSNKGDSFGVLIAVLDTNFWLATHVICISMGYSFSLITATLAHLYLYGSYQKISDKMNIIALIALFFTTTGTILGGVWADQSWGRFWGWDPKENGALLIIIWLVWVLHGKVTGHFKLKSYMMLLSFLNPIVALSWFGVNLLSVGLHSYGFTDRAGEGLLLFCITEFLLIMFLYRLQLKRRN